MTARDELLANGYEQSKEMKMCGKCHEIVEVLVKEKTEVFFNPPDHEFEPGTMHALSCGVKFDGD